MLILISVSERLELDLRRSYVRFSFALIVIGVSLAFAGY